MTQTNNTFDSKYAEDWLPIKSINNGMIQTDEGYYVIFVIYDNSQSP